MPDLLAAPRADDHIRFPRDHLFRPHNAVLSGALMLAVGEDVDATRDLDELRNPANAASSESSNSLKNTLGCGRAFCPVGFG